MELVIGYGLALLTVMTIALTVMRTAALSGESYNYQQGAAYYNTQQEVLQATIQYLNKSTNATAIKLIFASELASVAPLTTSISTNALYTDGDLSLAQVNAQQSVVINAFVFGTVISPVWIITVSNGINNPAYSDRIPELENITHTAVHTNVTNYTGSLSVGTYPTIIYYYDSGLVPAIQQPTTSLVNQELLVQAPNWATGYSQNWTVPPSVTQIVVTGCGGGSPGESGQTLSTAFNGGVFISGQDGSAGQCIDRQIIPVTSGHILSIHLSNTGDGLSEGTGLEAQTAYNTIGATSGAPSASSFIEDTSNSNALLFCASGGATPSMNNNINKIVYPSGNFYSNVLSSIQPSSAIFSQEESPFTVLYTQGPGGITNKSVLNSPCTTTTNSYAFYYPEWGEWIPQLNFNGSTAINGLPTNFVINQTINNEITPFSPASVMKWSLRIPSTPGASGYFGSFPAFMLGDAGFNGAQGGTLPLTLQCQNSCSNTYVQSTYYDPAQSYVDNNIHIMDASTNTFSLTESLPPPQPGQGGRGGIAGNYNADPGAFGVPGWILIEW